MRRTFTRVIGSCLLASISFSSLFAGVADSLLKMNRVQIKKKMILKVVNGKKKKIAVKEYYANFSVKDGTKDLRLPFSFEGEAGKYRLLAKWKPTNKIDVALNVPAGGRGLLVKKFGNRPGEKIFVIHDINLSRNNKGMKAEFSFKNNTGAEVKGAIVLTPVFESEERKRLDTLEKEKNRLAENQREGYQYLLKRLKALEKTVETLNDRIRDLEEKDSAASRKKSKKLSSSLKEKSVKMYRK